MYQNKYNLNYGTDPEFFCVSEKDDAEGISGFLEGVPFVVTPAVLHKYSGLGILGGPVKHPIYFDNAWYKIISDGAAFEINLKGPHKSVKDMWNIVHDAVEEVHQKVSEFGYEIYMRPVVNFNYSKWWTNSLMKNKLFYWSTIFGCDPDEDAFNVGWLAQIQDASEHPFRYGGGHIHLSGDQDIETYPLPFIKLLAVTLGNYTVLKSPFPELEKERAKYYGKPGKYRIQKYSDCSGVEYRTPSNSWLSYQYDDYEKMFELVDYALSLVKDAPTGQKILENYEDATVRAITRSDKNTAKEVLSAIGF